MAITRLSTEQLHQFHDFFLATAGASAALIGLLFVAITVRPRWLIEEETRAQSQTQAGSALIAFTNVLMLSTVALIPETNLGWLALPLGVRGLLFCIARARTLFAARRRGHAVPAWQLLVLGLIIISVYEAATGVRLLVSPHSHGAITTIAGLIVDRCQSASGGRGVWSACRTPGWSARCRRCSTVKPPRSSRTGHRNRNRTSDPLAQGRTCSTTLPMWPPVSRYS